MPGVGSVLHLLLLAQLVAVEAHMLTGATSKEESRAILERLTQTATGKGAVNQGEREIKLIYVTVRGATFTTSRHLSDYIAREGR